jgi:hypothetical protein
MKARVEQLALTYRVPNAAPRVAAQLPSLERALNARLADEIAAQLDAIDDGEEVIVVREATARVTLHLGSDARDSAIVDRVSHAARDAVLALLARPVDDDEQLRRFPSDAAFAGAFIVELLDGTAWDRWYFESFQRFRRADPRATIAALLADADTECMALFAWLETRGRLASMLTLVGPTAARSLASASARPDDTIPQPNELAPLSAAAFAIAATLGARVPPERQPELLAEYYRLQPGRPAWVDRGALTEWVWRFTRWIMGRASAPSAAGASPAPPPALVSLLVERLDWLDGEWIVARAEELPLRPPESHALRSRETHSLPITPRHATQLRALADAIRSGALRLDLRTEPRDQLLLRLTAALYATDRNLPSRPDHALVAVLDSLLVAAERAMTEARSLPAPEPLGDVIATPPAAVLTEVVSRAVDAAGAHGPDAVALMHALVAPVAADHGVWSSYAGIYLLTRPIADLRLERLATEAGVPWTSLLAALAMKLFGATPPFDAPTRLWIGDSEPDLAALDERALRTLQLLVMHALANQRQLPGDTVAITRFDWRDQSFEALSEASGTCWPLVSRASAATTDVLLADWRDAMVADPELVTAPRSPTADLEGLPAAPALPAAIEVLVTSVATCVMRAASRWLPGLSGSSAPFLVRSCIARAGSVSTTGDEIIVVCDHAPRDVVLEMSGCFSPMTSPSWLGRVVRFSFSTTKG